MDLYISSTGIISGAGNSTQEHFLGEMPAYDTDRLLAIEPDYKGDIPPMQLRRMSKAVRMGVAAAKMSMKQAGIEKPDAISVGTTLGCLQDTENFLQKMVEQDEQMLTPTAFIQSTHNTVAGQVALLAGCTGHNLTYTQRGHSFEHAMINAGLYLGDHPGEQVLTGGIDELTDTSVLVLKGVGKYRQNSSTPQSILNNATEGSIAGEGAAFFVTGDKATGKAGLHIKDLSLFVNRDASAALQQVHVFLSRNNITANNTDLVMLGINGDVRSKAFYDELQQTVFKDNSIATFKHLCGEYGTASSFALGLMLDAVQKQQFPASAIVNRPPSRLQDIVLVNNYMHYYSCWYISAY